MLIRMISAPLLALVVGLALLAPAPALGQTGRLYLGTEVGVFVPATDQQLVRVTVGNPRFAAPTADPEPLLPIFMEYEGIQGTVSRQTIEPGKTFTFMLDPREVGVTPDPNSGLRHVKVSFRVETEAVEGARAPQPSLTIEFLNRRTGKLESFHAFPGYTGGVYVAAGDVD